MSDQIYGNTVREALQLAREEMANMQEEIDALVKQRDDAMDEAQRCQTENSKLQQDIINLMRENKEYHDDCILWKDKFYTVSGDLQEAVSRAMYWQNKCDQVIS